MEGDRKHLSTKPTLKQTWLSTQHCLQDKKGDGIARERWNGPEIAQSSGCAGLAPPACSSSSQLVIPDNLHWTECVNPTALPIMQLQEGNSFVSQLPSLLFSHPTHRGEIRS